jgi:formylglycine-generating enzyme required for sulfatase activity
MHGNVWEWCLDQWHSNYDLDRVPKDGSAWLEADAKQANDYKDDRFIKRLLRGGSWDNHPGDCRSAFRSHYKPGNVLIDSGGLRVVCLPQGCSSTAARKPIG